MDANILFSAAVRGRPFDLLWSLGEAERIALESVGLPSKDAPIYATAVAIGAHVFVTGDLRHFGALMQRTGLPVPVRTV